MQIEADTIRTQILWMTRLVWTLVLLGVVVSVHGVWMFLCTPDFRLGPLGDFLGGAVASLWSLAGLVLIYIAFLGQKLQLISQQEEIELNRRELTEQNRTLRQQRFENGFFQLLKFHHDIVNAIDLSGVGGGRTRVGRPAFEQMYVAFQGFYNNHPGRLSLQQDELLRDAYARFFARYQPFVGHYFRSLYNIVKFVRRSELSNDDRSMYMNLIRAQLSSSELLLLFYNCLADVGKDFHPWVEEHNLLKTVPLDRLIDPTHKQFYPRSRFGH